MKTTYGLTGKFLVRDTETGSEYWWTVKQILHEVNRDRSDEWTDYNETDFMEGLEEMTEYEFVTDWSK